ncbi:MFS transporter [uncultured Phenylobacterium sp.]|uniref:MFS transporter n=1 Tax=uncultured Phenylobacterium sp. TaxID=349273 RepID=UPI0025D91571|nr:MFS transporter [uncultured Phenylobacterium sp.]
MAVAEGIPGATIAGAPALAGDLKPPARVKFFYSLGQFVESGYLAVNAHVFFYYTAVLGMSGSMVGAALAISLALDAAADPLIGSFSDSVRSKFGRRLPVMLLAAPLTMLTMGMLFSPPSTLTPFLLFLWLTVSKMGVRAFASMFNIPYFALGGEMSDDYTERARIVAWRLLAGILIGVATTFLAYSVFFAGEGGLQQPERYPAFGWTIAAMVLVAALLSCAGIWRYAAALPQPTTTPRPMTARLVGEVMSIMRNPTFLRLFLAMLIFSTSAGLHGAVQNHAYVFVWQLRPEAIQFNTYALLLGITIGVPVTPMLLKRIEKKTAVLIGFATVILSYALLPGIRAAGLFAPTGLEALPWLIATTFVVGLGSGLIFIALPSMMSDAADEHEFKYHERQEGLFFSGLGFAGKAAGGLGLLLGGVALDVLRFPREMGRQVNAVISEDVLAGLIIVWGPACSVLTLLGALVFAPYAITRVKHEAMLTELKRRRAAEL